MYSHVKSIATEFNLLKFVVVLTTLKQHFHHQCQTRKNLLFQMGLSSAELTGSFLQENRILVYRVAIQLQEGQYPPHHKWIYETEEIEEY